MTDNVFQKKSKDEAPKTNDDLTIETEYIGPVGDEIPPGTDIPKKEWKPGKGRASSNGTYTPGYIKDTVQNTYYTVALALSPFLPMTGHALYEVSENAAQIAEDWAQSDPKFREFILKLMKTSHGMKFAMANAPVAFAAFSEIKSRVDTGTVNSGAGSPSSAPGSDENGFENTVDIGAQVFKRQERKAAADAVNHTYSMPDHAVV